MHHLTPLSGIVGGALIGLAASMLMLLTGRIAGISGIFGGLLQPGAGDRGWRIAFVAGLLAAPLLASLSGTPLPAPAMPASLIVIVIAGFWSVSAAAWAAAAHPAMAYAVSHACQHVQSSPQRSSWPQRSPRSPSCVTVSEADAMLLVFVSFACGLVFGIGLLISGMTDTGKVLGFLDIFGAWDATLAFVMAGAVAVTGLGFALARRRGTPVLAAKNLWPTRRDVDTPLVIGTTLFGIGWGLVGLCPGPALVNLAGLGRPVIVFVVARAVGMLGHDAWGTRRTLMRQIEKA
jgi:uncharacterized membrane protein YedE/YeeE